MQGFISPYELNIKGTYEEPTDSGTTEEKLTWAQKTGAQYLNMAMSKMNPRVSESYDANQLVGQERATFKLMKYNRSFDAKGRLNIGGAYWYLEGPERSFQGTNNIILLDAVKKDNQS